MIKRLWHGWTTQEKADAYETLVRKEVFPGIAAKRIPGFQGAELLRREHGEEVEFVTLMNFDSLDDIRRLAGDDATVAYVPDKARALLSHWDEHARHYELRGEASA